MPLEQAVKDLLGDKFTEDQLIDQLSPDFQTKMSDTHVIRTKADDDSYVNSKVAQEFDTKIGDKIKEIHQKYEDDIKEVTGLVKKVNEKAYDFNKRILADLKIKAEAAGGDQALKDQIASLTETLSSKETEHATKLTELQTAAFTKQLNVLIQAEFDKKTIAIPAHITTDEAKQKYISDQKRLLKIDFLQNVTPKEDSEGNIVFYEGDKLLASTKDGKPLTADDLISDKYGSYFSVQQQKQGGAGSGKDGIPATGFTKSEEVYSYLEAKGLKPLTADFNAEAQKLMKEHGIVV
jgi:hypothetical protein